MNSPFTALKLPRTVAKVSAAAHVGPGNALTTSLIRFGARVWRTLEAVGRSRARRELLSLADRWESARPELAAQFRASCREELRA